MIESADGKTWTLAGGVTRRDCAAIRRSKERRRTQDALKRIPAEIHNLPHNRKL